MIRNTARMARRPHRCGRCFARIDRGERYLDSWMSPNHDGLGYTAWMHERECATCARTFGRSHLLEAAVAS